MSKTLIVDWLITIKC